MPLFHYQALNANRELVTGQLPAESLAQAVAQVESLGLSVQSISNAPVPGGREGESPFAADDASGRAVVERAALQQHMQRVIERGRDILPALRAYSMELPSGRQQRQLEEVLRILERGDAAHAASTLAVLPGYWIPLLGAATSSRDPARILREFLDESDRAAELHRQWWLTLAYPVLLAGIAAAVLTAISIVVIPTFRDIFAGFGLQVPVFTKVILTVADWIASGRILIAAVVLIAVAALLVRGTRLWPVSVRNWFSDHFGVRYGRATAIARFSQFTADLLEAELDPPQAIRLAGIATGNSPIRRAAWRVAGELQSGGDFARPGNRRILTATVLHALGGDSSAAARIRLLREISLCYAERARIRLSWTRGVIEPLAICAIGLVVGATVLAMFLPLFSLIQGLS
jgi:type II secretory pathway component PulF